MPLQNTPRYLLKIMIFPENDPHPSPSTPGGASRNTNVQEIRRSMQHAVTPPAEYLRPGNLGRTPVDRLYARVVAGPGDCHLWVGSKSRDGYGYFWLNPGRMYVHRFTYQLLVGNIPEHLQIDHLCCTRNCVNPLHMQLVTHAQNHARRRGKPQRPKNATHCVAGHPLSEDNVMVGLRNAKHCKQCMRSTA